MSKLSRLFMSTLHPSPAKAPMMQMAFTCLGLVVLGGCTTVREIRIENISTHNYTRVSVGDQFYGDIAPGETTEYKYVKLRFGYLALKLWADGRYTRGQTLNFGVKRFTYRIDIVDLGARQPAIEVIRGCE